MSSNASHLRPAAVSGALLASALSALIAPLPAHADDDGEAGSRTIIVTGQRPDAANPNANPNAPYKVEKSADGKYTQPLRDTPKSIVVIPKEVIEDIGATSLRDVVRTQPGVTLGTGEGGNAFGDRIFIRGFEARNDVYIDGMRDPGVSSREIFAVEQIEIVKGPSSSFGGRGTTGGSLSLQSKRPLRQNFVIADATVGTDNMYRGTVDGNATLTDTLSVRANALYHNADIPGRDYVYNERYGATAALVWEPLPGFTIGGDYYYYRYSGLPDYGHPFDSTTQRPFAVPRGNYYGVIGRDFIKSGADVATVNLTYEASDSIKIRSQSRYGKTFNRYVVSTPRAPCQRVQSAAGVCATTGPILPIDQWTVSVGSPQRNSDNSYYANITDATLKFDTGGIGHTAVVGFEFNTERVEALRYAFPATVEDGSGNIISAPGTFIRNLLKPNPVLGYTIPSVVDTTPATTTRVNTISVYALDTLTLTPQLEALIGLRYDDYTIHLDRLAGVASNGSPVTAIHTASQSGLFNGQASLVWKPVEAVSLYGSYSTSSNPSGEQLDGTSVVYGGLTTATANLEPERNRAFEVGGKFEFTKDALATVALFQTTKANAREQTSPGIYETVGELRSRGVELSVAGNITPRLAVFGGYAWIDATVVKSVTPANVGKAFPNIPEHAGNLLVTYKLTDRLTVGGQAYCQTEIHGGSAVAGTSTAPGYCRFDGVARYNFGPAELRVNVLNIADKTYYEAIYTSASPFSFVAPGRSANVSLSVKF